MLTFKFPLPPNHSQSSRRHWAVVHRDKKMWMEQADLLLMAKQLPLAPTQPYAMCYWSVLFRVWSLNDQDNLTYRCKVIGDWLRTRGYIAADDPKHLRFDGIPEQVIDRREQSVTVELLPILRWRDETSEEKSERKAAR